MQVILLERVDRLGGLGDVVDVKDGFARNYLLPQKKALRATDENREKFERERAVLEKLNAERRDAAGDLASGLDGETVIMIRQAGESGQLYGSVTARDIAEMVTTPERAITRGQVAIDEPIKAIGLHAVKVRLHPEVTAEVTVNVARTPEEAERQARGEDVIAAQAEEDRAIAEAQAAELYEANAEREGAEGGETRQGDGDAESGPESDPNLGDDAEPVTET